MPPLQRQAINVVKDIITVCCENHTEHTNSLCTQNEKNFNVL